MTLYVKCQTHECYEVATWKAGTWWFCAEHVVQYLFPAIGITQLTPREYLDGKDFDLPKRPGHIDSCFGTTYKHGPCRAEDYWTGAPPEGMAVEVTE